MTKKEINEADYDEISKNNNKSAAFVKRLSAYLIDMLIITMLSSILSYPFTANNKNNEKLSNELQQTVEKYTNRQIDAKTYISRTSDISYDLARQSGLSSIIYIALLVAYFVVFQFKNNGKTFGKQIMKIKVVKIDKKDLSMNDLLFRSSIINLIFAQILTLCITLFCSKDIYFVLSGTVELVCYGIIFISVIMILSRKDKRGLHDLICKTEVINE